MITQSALEEFVIAINEKFDSEKNTALTLVGSSIYSSPEILKFSGFDTNETLDTVLSRGIVSLRPGYYKIVGAPFYKDNLEFATFSAKVHYFESSNDRIIEFNANVGPMTNTLARYLPLTKFGVQDELYRTFLAERTYINRENFYYMPKKRFFDNLYLNNKIFRVKSAGYASDHPGQKQVLWSFLS